MKNALLFVFVCITIIFTGCPQGGTTTSGLIGKQDVVASLDGNEITVEELDANVKDQMQRVDMQIYQIRKQGLDTLVEEKLIEVAAKKSGKSVEEYTKEEIDAKVEEPSEDELRALYNARKGKDALPFEKVKDQLVSFMEQNKRNKARMDLLAKLKNEADVKVFLEPPRVTVDVSGAPAMGPKDAKVTLVEFSDYQCPFCKRVRPTIWQLTDEYKDKMRYVFMDFPLSFHQFAQKAHEAAHCAGDQGKYFEYNKKIFENQKELTVPELKKYAGELKLNKSEFNKCLDSGAHAKDVAKNMRNGMSVGVSGTPAFFINGIQLSGARPIASFKEIIEEELNK